MPRSQPHLDFYRRGTSWWFTHAGIVTEVALDVCKELNLQAFEARPRCVRVKVNGAEDHNEYIRRYRKHVHKALADHPVAVCRNFSIK